MKELRILVIEAEAGRWARVAARFETGAHSVRRAVDCGKALEALFIDEFEVILIGGGQTAGEAEECIAVLRELEAGRRGSKKAPPRATVLLYAPELALAPGVVDGTLDPGFDYEQFSAAIEWLGVPAFPGSEPPVGTDQATATFATFDPEEFKTQCMDETELMLEIIDLFEQERTRALPEMNEALRAGDYERLYRMAHTIKGSLGTLHAPRARQQASDLETASKEQDYALCARTLAALDAALVTLWEQLTAFRSRDLKA